MTAAHPEGHAASRGRARSYAWRGPLAGAQAGVRALQRGVLRLSCLRPQALPEFEDFAAMPASALARPPGAERGMPWEPDSARRTATPVLAQGAAYAQALAEVPQELRAQVAVACEEMMRQGVCGDAALLVHLVASLPDARRGALLALAASLVPLAGLPSTSLLQLLYTLHHMPAARQGDLFRNLQSYGVPLEPAAAQAMRVAALARHLTERPPNVSEAWRLLNHATPAAVVEEVLLTLSGATLPDWQACTAQVSALGDQIPPAQRAKLLAALLLLPNLVRRHVTAACLPLIAHAANSRAAAEGIERLARLPVERQEPTARFVGSLMAGNSRVGKKIEQLVDIVFALNIDQKFQATSMTNSLAALPVSGFIMCGVLHALGPRTAAQGRSLLSHLGRFLLPSMSDTQTHNILFVLENLPTACADALLPLVDLRDVDSSARVTLCAAFGDVLLGIPADLQTELAGSLRAIVESLGGNELFTYELLVEVHNVLPAERPAYAAALQTLIASQLRDYNVLDLLTFLPRSAAAAQTYMQAVAAAVEAFRGGGLPLEGYMRALADAAPAPAPWTARQDTIPDDENVMFAVPQRLVGRAIRLVLDSLHLSETQVDQIFTDVCHQVKKLQGETTLPFALGHIRAGRREIDNVQRVLTGPKNLEDFSAAVQASPASKVLSSGVWKKIEMLSMEGKATPQEQELMRYSFLMALAQCIEDDGHRVCGVGFQARMIRVLQGYVPEAEVDSFVASPAQLLTHLAERFVQGLGGERDPSEAELLHFYQQSSEDAAYLYETAHPLKEQFQEALLQYLQFDHDFTPPRDPDAR